MYLSLRSCIGLLLAGTLVLAGSPSPAQDDGFTDAFPLGTCRFASRGHNAWFPLLPGYRLTYTGEEDGESLRLQITVLHRQKWVDGVRTRVVEEREWVDDELAEVSYNYFALCRQNGGVFYFGEDVDIYEYDADGELLEVTHEGAWRAGVDGARAGLIMPGLPLLGSRYYQEVAPGVAEDRAEHLSLSEVVETPAGTFENCLLVEETTPLEPDAVDYKLYAPGVGLVEDAALQLVEYGFVRGARKDDRDDN